MLSGERVLVAEDECLIAMDLADIFEVVGVGRIPGGDRLRKIQVIQHQTIPEALPYGTFGGRQ